MKPFFAASLVVAVVASVPTYRASAAPASSGHDHVGAVEAEPADMRARAQVFRKVDGKFSCGDATSDEAQQLMAVARDDESLRVIYSGGANKGAGGLTIVLIGTEQLEANRQAKNAFIRAAQTWEGIIKSQITINVKVDFGPTRFGREWDSDVLGSTSSGEVAKPYAEVRAALIAGASSPEELALYNQLPQTTMLTDSGPVETIRAPSAAFRALGLLPPTPDREFFPPSIGFNDGFPYDFDPSDGVASNRTDFNAVVLHELGHLLGFISSVGDLEDNSSGTPALSLWDLFRFRPGATLDAFGTRERILASGGEQVFFDGRPSLPLSTGRGDGTGGDGRQASHWKDDSQNSGRYVGIMDPTIPDGEEFKIVPADLRALDLFGYRFTNGAAPTLSSLTADLAGDVLTIAGAFSDANGDVAQAEATFLDLQGGVVGESALVRVDSGSSSDFTIELPGLSAVPAAAQVSVVLIDRAGNGSDALTADFSRADAGGPLLAKVAFKNDKMKIRGNGLAGEIELEINGVVLGMPITPTAAGTKIKLSGSAGDLNLRGGANRVRLRAGGLRSNIMVVNL